MILHKIAFYEKIWLLQVFVQPNLDVFNSSHTNYYFQRDIIKGWIFLVSASKLSIYLSIYIVRWKKYIHIAYLYYILQKKIQSYRHSCYFSWAVNISSQMSRVYKSQKTSIPSRLTSSLSFSPFLPFNPPWGGKNPDLNHASLLFKGVRSSLSVSWEL